MKRFNKIIIKDKEVFFKVMVDEIILRGMKFSSENLNAMYGGKFMIRRIENNTII